MTQQTLGNVLLSGGSDDENLEEGPQTGRWTPWLMATLVVVILFFCRHSLLILYDTYSYREDWQHGFLIPIVSAYAAYGLFKSRGFSTDGPSLWGILGILGGAALVILGEWYELFIGNSLGGAPLCAAGVIGMITGLVLACGGWRSLFTYRFPFLYLLFGIPWPMGLVNALSRPLRQLASAMAEPTFRILGIPVLREGNLFHFASLSMGMEDACSGIRSLGVMLAAAVAIAYFVQTTLGGGMLLVIAAVVCAILANYLRVVLTGVLGTQVDPIFVSDSYHEATGYVTFILGFAALMLIARLLRPQSRDVGSREVAESARPAQSDHRTRAWHTATVIAIIGILSLGTWARASLERHYIDQAVVVPAPSRTPLEDLPMTLGPYTCVDVDTLSAGERNALKPSDALVRVYANAADERLHCRILYWTRIRRRYAWRNSGRQGEWIGPHSPDACYTAIDWVADNDFPKSVRVGNIETSYRVFRKPASALVNVFWAHRKLTDQYQVLRGGRQKVSALLASLHEQAVLGYQYQYSVSIDVSVGPNGVPAATKLATDFGELLLEHLPQHGIPPPTQKQE